ncbi:glycosyltransferase family 2 protein [Singulisphaera acidiphila]|uniref:Glycosyl transferase n=1 Tax=Singulisphaera acidiphila (strain ATCC BAA-1392 / DSM 18658 / VKM B-2454 / MOB10) TaxID=886293 RepID=L0DH11_SINAD|nr:glycosyltransferase family 2 protein [Singulisphaera acidiphila]AGA28140.1 glycosyl transferase [Singulisphaera acidiphila DSM 18658]
MRADQARTLTIVLPALNEEEAIGGTLRRCLDARAEIQRVARLDAIEIIVVSDGSTDRTVEIARGFEEVQVIVFEKNRGYGAAIKEGFAQGTGSLVGFIDADGTCDPHYFGEMCRQALDEGAEVVLGSRMGADSKMPRIRRVGNVLYAILLGILCGRRVTDTASGMRVIRRSALDMLYPLPDRLHFTPSMSAKALINGLRVVEIPMRYEERIGTSKLSVLKDGVRFLRTIFEGVLCYRPERLFLMAFSACLLLGLVLAANPVEYYAHNRRIEEWMIYRFVACFMLGSAGFMLLAAAVLANRMSALGPKRRDGDSFWMSAVIHCFAWKPLLIFAGLSVLGSLVLLAPGIWMFVTSGRITLHWSRIMVGAFGLMVAFQALITLVMLQVASIWVETAKFHERESLRRANENAAAGVPQAAVALASEVR